MDVPRRTAAFGWAPRLCAAALLAALAGNALSPSAAPRAADDDLRRFFREAHSFTAKFNQVVLDESLNPLQESAGTLWIVRPNRFRWDYDVPFKQQIISDGRQIWVYDVELKQATVRNFAGALGTTPAILLAGQGKIDDDFVVKNLGEQGKLQWVQLVPRNRDGGFEDIRVGFERGKLRLLEMIDGFGQTTRIALRDGEANVAVDSSKFVFKPPAGVDIVRERSVER